jgi:hypothetical protein
VASISRFLDPEQAVAAATAGEVEVLDSRRLGGAWALDRLWERLRIGAAVSKVAAGRRVDGDVAERVMDFLLNALEEIAGEIFWSVTHLLNLDVDIVFVDTTSTYWELEVAETADLGDGDEPPGEAGSGTPRTTATTCPRW